MRIFVTGATGVVGRRVVPALIAHGHQVTAVGRSEEKRAMLRKAGAEPLGLDLNEAEGVRRAVTGHEAILNLATAVPSSSLRALLPGAWREMDRVRREVSENLVRAALAGNSVCLMVQESFAPVYEDGGDQWINETSPVRPGNYNRSVLDAESQVMRLTRDGRTGIVLRFGAFYGPKDPLTTEFIDSARRGWFALFGRRESYFPWLSHDDAASAVVAALGIPAGTYNVVDTPMSRGEVADGVAEMLGVKPLRFFPPWAARLAGSVGETLSRSLRISNRKFATAGVWTPRHPTILDGLREIIG